MLYPQFKFKSFGDYKIVLRVTKGLNLIFKKQKKLRDSYSSYSLGSHISLIKAIKSPINSHLLILVIVIIIRLIAHKRDSNYLNTEIKLNSTIKSGLATFDIQWKHSFNFCCLGLWPIGFRSNNQLWHLFRVWKPATVPLFGCMAYHGRQSIRMKTGRKRRR